MAASRRITGMAGFVVVWFGQLVSTTGSGLTAWGLGVWLYQDTKSTTLFVLSLLAYTLPHILVAPFAGLVVDRWDRRWVMILADCGAGLSTLGIALLLWTGGLQIWHVYVAIAINSASTTFQWPAYGAATTMLVPKNQLGRASGMVQFGEAISQLLTPGIAGALYVTLGLPSIVLVDLGTFLFAVLATLSIHVPRPEKSAHPDEGEGSLWHEVTFGWRYIAARPGLFGLLRFFAVANFCASMSLPLLTPMLLNIATPDQVGLIGSISGIGMVAGTLVMGIWGGPKKRRTVAILTADSTAGLFVLLAGLTPIVPVIGLGMAGFLFTVPLANGNSQAMWQSKVPPDVQGRVFTVRRMLAQSIEPIALLLAGPLSEIVFEPLLAKGGPLAASIGQVIGVGPGRGSGLMLVVMGAIYCLAGILTFLNPRVRRLDLEIPDARPDEASVKIEVAPDVLPAAK